jgi:hypothetical protein
VVSKRNGVIHMEARAHGPSTPAAQTDPSCANQAGVSRHQPRHIGNESFIAMQIRRFTQQIWQYRLLLLVHIDTR